MGILSRIFGGAAPRAGGRGEEDSGPAVEARDAAEGFARGEAVPIDVRFDGEFARGRVPGSRLIPLPELPGRLGEIPRDRPVVLVSGRGARAREAAAYLRSKGFERARWLRGGLGAFGAAIERDGA